MGVLTRSPGYRTNPRVWLTRVCNIAFLALVLATSSHAQQIASTDLAHSVVTIVGPHQEQNKDEFATNCGKSGVGFADGVVTDDDHKPRRIEVELVPVSDTRLVIGTNVEATIRLKNVGTEAIQIPWSTDFRTTQDGQDPKMRSWDVGWFQLELKSTETNNNAELKSTSQNLFASKLLSGSSLTIRSGEWITAQISSKVEAQNPTFEHVKEGSAELSVEWSQTARARRVEDCGVTLGYFTYTYQQDNPSVIVKVENEQSDTTKKTAE